jgi:hypothetical protein
LLFPDATLQSEAKMGRLNIISLGDANKDGKYEELYAFGGRSFTIWNGDSGSLVLIVKIDLDADFGTYDGRSDGSEPESVVVAKMGSKDILL